MIFIMKPREATIESFSGESILFIPLQEYLPLVNVIQCH